MATINWNTSALKEIEDRIKAALYAEGTQLVGQSVPLVPVDTGALRSSAFTEQPTTSGDKISVRCGYGGTATKVNPLTGETTTDYAVKVHEDLNVHHDVGQAKFLEIPANNLKSKFDSNMKRRLGI